MKTMRHSLRMRMTALLLALVCVVGLLPISAMAAGTDTIKLERFGMSGVSYTSASLGTCTLHQMYYDYGGETTVGFCGTKGGGMGASLIGQTWGSPQEIADHHILADAAYQGRNDADALAVMKGHKDDEEKHEVRLGNAVA